MGAAVPLFVDARPLWETDVAESCGEEVIPTWGERKRVGNGTRDEAADYIRTPSQRISTRGRSQACSTIAALGHGEASIGSSPGREGRNRFNSAPSGEKNRGREFFGRCEWPPPQIPKLFPAAHAPFRFSRRLGASRQLEHLPLRAARRPYRAGGRRARWSLQSISDRVQFFLRSTAGP